MIRALYTDSTCDVRVGGVSVSGFRMDLGVRQGCPLSPLLCVVAVDGLLRRLAAAVPSSVPRVYADDTAIVLAGLARDARRLQLIFTELEAAAALALHLRQTMVYHLGLTMAETRRGVADSRLGGPCPQNLASDP